MSLPVFLSLLRLSLIKYLVCQNPRLLVPGPPYIRDSLSTCHSSAFKLRISHHFQVCVSRKAMQILSLSHTHTHIHTHTHTLYIYIYIYIYIHNFIMLQFTSSGIFNINHTHSSSRLNIPNHHSDITGCFQQFQNNELWMNSI